MSDNPFQIFADHIDAMIEARRAAGIFDCPACGGERSFLYDWYVHSAAGVRHRVRMEGRCPECRGSGEVQGEP
jgi:hypothetical protein